MPLTTIDPRPSPMPRFLTLALLALLVACTAEPPNEQAFDPERPWRKPGDVIDSIFPMEEYLRRFREGTTAPTGLSGGAPSPDSLAARVLAAVSAHDSAALGALALTRSEFGWLVFPEHRYSAPPYELDPAIFWLQIQASSQKGADRLLHRYGGQALTLRGVSCSRDTLQLIGTGVTMQSGCVVRFTADGTDQQGQLFGSIVERDGVAKLVGFANDL